MQVETHRVHDCVMRLIGQLRSEKLANYASIFTRCIPTACFSDLDLKDDIVRKLRSRTDQGRLEFKDGTQREVTVPVSFKGFSQALDAMAKE